MMSQSSAKVAEDLLRSLVNGSGGIRTALSGILAGRGEGGASS
ncbi:hypothetical protein ES703_00797 [subsurface metagenome]